VRPLKNILSFGIKTDMSHDTKRRILLTNNLSLILVGALLIFVFFRNAAGYSTNLIILILGVSFFISPLVLNYFHQTSLSRILLCYGTIIFIWFAAISEFQKLDSVDPLHINDVRVFFISVAFIPYLLIDPKRHLLLFLGILPTVISIVFYDQIFSLFKEILPYQNLDNTEIRLVTIRWKVGYSVISLGFITFQRIIFAKDREKLQLISTLYQQKEEIVAQNDQLNKLSFVANESTNAITIFDAHGNFEWVNDGFVKLYEVSVEDLNIKEGKSLFQTIPNSYTKEMDKKNRDLAIKAIISKVENCIQQKKTVHYEYSTVADSGKDITVRTTLTPILNSEGNIINLVGIDTDITKLKKAEQRIINQNEQLKLRQNELNKLNNNLEELVNEQTKDIQKKNEILAYYAFTNAHKLRGPVARLLGLFHISKLEKEMDAQWLLNKLEKETISIDEIVRNISKELNSNSIYKGDDIS